MFKQIKNKKLALVIFFAIIVVSFSVGKIKAESSNINLSEIVFNYTERIYSYIYCSNRICENKYSPALGGGESKELFTFYGYDANCDNFKDECANYNCTGLNNLECLEAKDECEHNKIILCQNNNPYGQSGSVKINGDLETYGTRMYLDGYDSFGFHWFKTGLDSPGGKAIGFKEGTKDVYFNNNLYQSGNDSNISLNNSSNVQGKIIWGDENYIANSEEYIKAENGKINFHSESENIMEIDGSATYNTKILNGLEVNNTLETEAMLWKGDTNVYNNLMWSPILGMTEGYPNPSLENKQILFYCNNPSADSGGCI